MDEKIRGAVEAGDMTALKKVWRPEAVSDREKYGDTLLHIACRGGKKEIVAFLISEGADLNAKGAADLTPLMSASLDGHWNISSLLLEHGAVITPDLLATLRMKVGILEENHENGMITEEGLRAWQGFLNFIREKQAERELPEQLRLLAEGNPDQQEQALEAVEKAAQRGADISAGIPALRKMLGHEIPEFRFSAAAALAGFYLHKHKSGEFHALSGEVKAEELPALMSVLVAFSRDRGNLSDLMPLIIGYLRHENDDLRHDAAIVVGYQATAGFPVPEAIPALVNLFRDGDAAIRKMSLWAIYRIAKYTRGMNPDLREKVRKMTEDPDEEVSSLAREILGLSTEQ